MNHDHYDDAYLRDLLESTHTIAIVGASPKPDRPSHGVMVYLKQRGYRVIPVNPGIAGETILGELCYASLNSLPVPVDMVDVFRTADAVPEIVDAAIRIGAKIVWTQLGVRDDEAAAKAEAAGIKVVMNRCPAIEIPRLGLS